ncbi:Oxoglutarate/iron-dependent dioxygenase [uncultured Caudovirales phage]|uniref:Oxoglutarate/iron-dependent dioxygenase n=1 Tax=uncultured Caudovirales phage TaxID=2100421 RepID=A0A6J5NLQ8_9CAUD|nr:Oxoglutarate/iron-dependent dioxygenase [uncultured Caudovirales phage]CAB4156257.1 Oxoglutarate/iron-dependent dioxygenase [uncultured Caudovirales phage]CAB4160319.1 Oxoglutarate/iron-dependent dioxygenase [uncultured Caudovirales phage]CAB4164727.1 Oxoglutarate/iron-dependent dioxygenase [uncultured Caudovirales phage]CAB4171681.1 Oxoglutarate/iron-dependent dioxygenase [uncultured Caudovirales phage]
MGNAVMADGASLPFVYLTNFLSESDFHAVLGQALGSQGATSEQTPHLVNLQGIETWSIGKNIESLYPLHCQRKMLKIKGGNILDFSNNRGMDYHQDSVPNKDYPDDPEIGFTPNASAVYYLNDDYEGGEVCFTTERPPIQQAPVDTKGLKNLFTLKPQPNSCVFFDANLWHWVRPVTKGRRFSSTYFLLVE